MKNALKTALLSFGVFTLAACGTPTPATSSEASKTSSPSKWGEEYTLDIVGNLGEDLPYLACDNFDVVITEDDYGDPLVCIYCYVPEDEISDYLIQYGDLCAYAGYDVTFDTMMAWDQDGMSRYYYDVYFADKVITPTKGIEIQFLEGNYKGKECLGIFAYNYTYVPEDEWPTNLVIDLLGHDIPHLEDNGRYKYDVHINSEGYIDMTISGVEADAEERYIKLLEDNDYLVGLYGDFMSDGDEFDYSDYGYLAYPPGTADEIDHVIQFGQTNYGLEIYIYGREKMGG